MAGVALGGVNLGFAWQVWRLAFVLRGRHGTYDIGLDLVARLVKGFRLNTQLLRGNFFSTPFWDMNYHVSHVI